MLTSAPSSGPRNRASGFTLLEILVAMALLVIISGALYSTYFALLRGREMATAGMEQRRELRTTLDMVRRELSAALFIKGSGKDHEKNYRLVVEDRDFFGKPASTLALTTIAPPRSGNQPHSDQLEVQYLPVRGEGKIVLMRQARDLHLNIAPLSYPQMEEVESFLVECSTDGVKWVRTWDTALNSTLPTFIRVTIGIREGEKVVEFSTTASPQISGS